METPTISTKPEQNSTPITRTINVWISVLATTVRTSAWHVGLSSWSTRATHCRLAQIARTPGSSIHFSSLASHVPSARPALFATPPISF